MAESIATANWRERLMFFLGQRDAFRVEGESMSPTISAGDAVLIRRQAYVSQGEIVLVRHPFKQGSKLIKRVRDVEDDGGLFLIGDNEDESTDSRSFGRITSSDIIGVVTCRLK